MINGPLGLHTSSAARTYDAIYCTLAGATAAAQPGDSIAVAQLGPTDTIAGSGQPGAPITVYGTRDDTRVGHLRGDGSKPSASGTHTYAAPGDYTGSATFTGVGGETQAVPFPLSPRPTVVDAYADVSTPDSTDLDKIQFHVYGAPGGATYVLDFGDGQKQTLSGDGIVTHQHAGAGVYQVSVTATSNGWTGTESYPLTLWRAATRSPTRWPAARSRRTSAGRCC